MRKFSFFITIILLISCLTKEDDIDKDEIINQTFEHTGIIIPDFTFVKSESSFAIGDYSESFLIKFDSLEFEILVERILKSQGYDSRISLKNNDNVNQDTNGKWQNNVSGYKNELFYRNDKHITLINYYVNSNNKTLYYLFIDE